MGVGGEVRLGCEMAEGTSSLPIPEKEETSVNALVISVRS